MANDLETPGRRFMAFYATYAALLRPRMTVINQFGQNGSEPAADRQRTGRTAKRAYRLVSGNNVRVITMKTACVADRLACIRCTHCRLVLYSCISAHHKLCSHRVKRII